MGCPDCSEHTGGDRERDSTQKGRIQGSCRRTRKRHSGVLAGRAGICEQCMRWECLRVTGGWSGPSIREDSFASTEMQACLADREGPLSVDQATKPFPSSHFRFQFYSSTTRLRPVLRSPMLISWPVSCDISHIPAKTTRRATSKATHSSPAWDSD